MNECLITFWRANKALLQSIHHQLQRTHLALQNKHRLHQRMLGAVPSSTHLNVSLHFSPPPLTKVLLCSLRQKWEDARTNRTALLVHAHASAVLVVAAAVARLSQGLWGEAHHGVWKHGYNKLSEHSLLSSAHPPWYQEKSGHGGTSLSSKLLRKMMHDFKFKSNLGYRTSLRTT